MKVTLVGQISGARDGKPWPAAGESIEVSDEEGKSLCESGLAWPADSREAKTENAKKNESTVTLRAESPAVESLPKDDSGVPYVAKPANERATTKKD